MRGEELCAFCRVARTTGADARKDSMQSVERTIVMSLDGEILFSRGAWFHL